MRLHEPEPRGHAPPHQYRTRCRRNAILGGGFGLYLKQLYLQRQVALQTLLPGDLWPYARATEDLDIILPTEVVVSLSDMQALRAALDRLGFKPVEEARFLHFVRAWGDRGRVKIDLLIGWLRC